MTQVSFYHLTKTSVDEALPKLLEKVLENDSKALMVVENNEEIPHYDKLLWSVGGTRLIPHGINGEGDEEMQPVLISEKIENNNKANFLVTIGKYDSEEFVGFERSLYIFNGNDKVELEFARNKWKGLKSNDKLTLKYYFQNDKGNWEEK